MRIAPTQFRLPMPLAAAPGPAAALTKDSDGLCMRSSRTFSSASAAQNAAEMAAYTYGVELDGVDVEPSGGGYYASARFCDDGVFAESSLKMAVSFFKNY
jgi:hypothetical protein